LSNRVKTKTKNEQKNHTQTRNNYILLGRKWYGNVKEAKKFSLVKYETNSAAKRKAIWSQKLDFFLQNGRLRENKWRVFMVSNNRVLYSNASNKQDLIRRKKK